jgi:hypothetical protein
VDLCGSRGGGCVAGGWLEVAGDGEVLVDEEPGGAGAHGSTSAGGLPRGRHDGAEEDS